MTDAFTATVRVADALAAAHIPYAIGGSIAMAASGYARMTIDGDINVFLPMAQARPAFHALLAAGFEVDVEEGAKTAAERGDGRFHVDGIRIDLFFDSIPLHPLAAGRTVEVWIGDRAFPALSPEDLVVLNALFNRGKDWADIERIVAAMGARFDGVYARGQLVAHAGHDDPGVARLDGLLEAWARPAPGGGLERGE